MRNKVKCKEVTSLVKLGLDLLPPELLIKCCLFFPITFKDIIIFKHFFLVNVYTCENL